jgi:hypothetical protein
VWGGGWIWAAASLGGWIIHDHQVPRYEELTLFFPFPFFLSFSPTLGSVYQNWEVDCTCRLRYHLLISKTHFRHSDQIYLNHRGFTLFLFSYKCCDGDDDGEREREREISSVLWTQMSCQNYWTFGLCPSFGILIIGEHDVSETGSISVVR